MILRLFGKQKEAKIQTGDSGRPVLAATSESRLLLPQPGIDVQSDINFAALRPQNQGPGSLPESRDDYNNRIAIITGFNIDKNQNLKNRLLSKNRMKICHKPIWNMTPMLRHLVRKVAVSRRPGWTL